MNFKSVVFSLICKNIMILNRCNRQLKVGGFNEIEHDFVQWTCVHKIMIGEQHSEKCLYIIVNFTLPLIKQKSGTTIILHCSKTVLENMRELLEV